MTMCVHYWLYFTDSFDYEYRECSYCHKREYKRDNVLMWGY